MDAWIGRIAVAALERGDGVSSKLWRSAAYRDFPAQLKALYSEMDGVHLPGEVRLFPASELSGPSGGERAWHFGRKGAHEHLFALRKSDALEAVSERPKWLQALSHDAWVYGVKAGAVGPIRLFRSLSTLLEVLVPPRQTEDFGEHTFAHAFALVEQALGAIEENGAADRPAKAKRKAAPQKRPAKVPGKKTGSARRKTAKPVASQARARGRAAPARKRR